MAVQFSAVIQLGSVIQKSLFQEPRSMRLLIQRGAKLNACSSNQFTPLHLAAFKGDLETSGLIIDHLRPEDIDAAGKESINVFTLVISLFYSFL